VLQTKPQAPLVQTGLAFAGAVQTVAQPPQLCTSVCSLTQAPLQGEKPALQATPHVPPEQVGWALATFVVHDLPHVPQLLGSDVRLIQLPLQQLGVAVGQHAPLQTSGWPPGAAGPHV
jgi:hypothetical protein